MTELASTPQDPQPAESKSPNQSALPRPKRRGMLTIGAGLMLGYLGVAYVLMPLFWKVYIHRHPALDDVPGITETTTGIPGDPINVALVGTRAEIDSIMQAAGWYPADALGLKSDLKIAADTVLERPYDAAPVSSLYLYGRKEDLAYEKPVGDDPKQRNHVRFWQSDKSDPDGRSFWMGSATYDERVGLSHTTGEITHHIAADVDTERDRLMHDLQQTGDLSETYTINDFHKVRDGRNGGGDPWHTDGRLMVGILYEEPSQPTPVMP